MTVDPVVFRVEQAAKVLARRIPPRFTDATATHPQVKQWMKQFLTDPQQTPSLILSGPTGVGKTWQCWGAVRAVVEARAKRGYGTSWRVITHPEFNAALRPRPDNSHTTAIEPLLAADLLMVDDLAAGKQTEWTGDSLFRLVDHRWSHQLPTIFSTNLPPQELADAVGDRVYSRFADAIHITIKGDDRRWAARQGAAA